MSSSAPAPAPSPATAVPLPTGRKAVVALGGALAGAAVMLAANTLTWGVLTYPLAGTLSETHNLYIAIGVAALVFAMLVSWGVFRWIGALRPWLAALVTVALCVPVTLVLMIPTSLLMAATGGNYAIYHAVSHAGSAIACAALYLLVVRGERRRA